jgi:hypothetical protein
MVRAGAQFVLRTHAGPLSPWSLSGPDCCRRHGVHGGLVNASVASEPASFLDSASGGGSALHGPDGATRARAPDGAERTVSALLRLGGGGDANAEWPG